MLPHRGAAFWFSGDKDMWKWFGLVVGSAVLLVVVLTVGLLNVGRFEGSEHFYE